MPVCAHCGVLRRALRVFSSRHLLCTPEKPRAAQAAPRPSLSLVDPPPSPSSTYERERTCDALCKRVYVNRVCMRWDMEPCTRTEPTTLSRGNPAQTGRHLGQGERSPSNKPYLQRVTEWTTQCLYSDYTVKYILEYDSSTGQSPRESGENDFLRPRLSNHICCSGYCCGC